MCMFKYVYMNFIDFERALGRGSCENSKDIEMCAQEWCWRRRIQDPLQPLLRHYNVLLQPNTSSHHDNEHLRFSCHPKVSQTAEQIRNKTVTLWWYLIGASAFRKDTSQVIRPDLDINVASSRSGTGRGATTSQPTVPFWHWSQEVDITEKKNIDMQYIMIYMTIK